MVIKLKKLDKSLPINNVKGFDEFIRKAIDIKIKSNKNMMSILATTDLPFTHYYVFGGFKKEAGHEWIVEHIENRRILLKEYFNKK